MIPYPFYKLVHLLGLFMLFLVLGGIARHVLTGGRKADNPRRKSDAILHGVAMMIVLTGGFGMLARLGIHWPFPGWVLVKLGIWIVFGLMMALLYRLPKLASTWWLLMLVLGLGAAVCALLKPF